jgi:hypothetical protein
MIENLDFEIEECMVILIIVFVLASGVIIPNAIIKKIKPKLISKLLGLYRYDFYGFAR